jgi:formamidopyrimidine-DNA glycosylase
MELYTYLEWKSGGRRILPEYPEMATYTNLLRQNVLGLEIAKTEIERDKSINLPTDEFQKKIKHQRIMDIRSRGKHILFQFSGNCTGVVHLMLGGWMFYSLPEEAPDRTKQLTFSFTERREQLYFINLRLGYFHLLSAQDLEDKLAPLGPEALSETVTLDRMKQLLQKSRGNLKAFFLDQKKLAGIGNAYSDEICFNAELNPHRQSREFTEEETKRLYESMHEVLQKGAQWGGYMDQPFTPRDTWTGRMNDHFQVYDREGQACYRCGATITTQRLAGRTSYFCPNCQR